MVLAQQGQTLDWFSLVTTLVATLVGGLLAVGTCIPGEDEVQHRAF
jgi:hypothetical protein